MKPRQCTLIRLLLVCIFGIANINNSSSALAQVVDISWSTPSRIPGFTDSGLDPILIKDSEGTIHLFNSQNVAGNQSISYIRWTLKDGWSALVDIITAPLGGARIFGVHLDQQGWMHLIFFGGDGLDNNIFYTKAPVQNVSKSTAWSKPLIIGEAAISPASVATVGDGQGFLMVVYSGNINGNGLYTVQSQDGGRTWSSPRPMFVTYSQNLWPFALKLLIDEEKTVFAVWSVHNDVGFGKSINFSRYSQSDLLWTHPVIIADAIDNYHTSTPSIIKYHDEVFLIFHNDQPTTHWMSRSSDNGETWSQPIRLFHQVGGNGPVSMVIDSNDTLHMLFGNRVDETGTHGVWHSMWFDGRWKVPEPMVSGPQIPIGPNDEEGFDPSFIQAVVSRGNLLFVIWRHDPVAGPTSIWYSYRILDAPEYPSIPLQKPVIIESTPADLVNETDVATTPSPSIISTQPISPSSAAVESRTPANNPNFGIFLGISAVGILLLVVSIIRKQLK